MAGEEIAPEGAAPLPEGDVAAAPVEAVVEAPAAAAAAPEAAPAATVEAAPEPAAEEPKPAEDAPAEPEKAPEPVKAEEPKPEAAAEPAPEAAPAYAEFKLPEGLQVAPEQLEAFTGLLAEAKVSQETGQKFMDMHGQVLKQYAADLDQRQRDVFDETRADWRKLVDKQFGNRRNTVVEDAKWAIEQIVPNEKARKDLWGVLAFTGVGDHPALIGALASAAKLLRERAAPPRGLPPKGPPQRAADKRYGAQS